MKPIYKIVLCILIAASALFTVVSLKKNKNQQELFSLSHEYLLIQSARKYDLEAIRTQVPIVFSTPLIEETKTLSAHRHSIKGQVKGGNEEIFQILGRTLQEGTFFSPMQVKTAAKVAVLGLHAAQELFGGLEPIGKRILIDGMFYTVIGILKEDNTHQMPHQNNNLDVFVPYTTFGKRTENIAIQLDKAQEAVSWIKSLLRFRHGLKQHEGDDFAIYTQKILMKQ